MFSETVSIFVDRPDPVEQLVARVEPVLSVQFQRPANGSDARFEARTADAVITIDRHEFENDRDLTFEDYSYEIEFRPLRDQFYSLHEARTQAYAREVFVGLQTVLNCSMMLVNNLQRKVAEFTPPADLPLVLFRNSSHDDIDG